MLWCVIIEIKKTRRLSGGAFPIEKTKIIVCHLIEMIQDFHVSNKYIENFTPNHIFISKDGNSNFVIWFEGRRLCFEYLLGEIDSFVEDKCIWKNRLGVLSSLQLFGGYFRIIIPVGFNIWTV